MPPDLASRLKLSYCVTVTVRLNVKDAPVAETVTVLVPGGVLGPVDVVEEMELPQVRLSPERLRGAEAERRDEASPSGIARPSASRPA